LHACGEVRAVAAIPAIGLLIGSAVGVWSPDFIAGLGDTLLIAFTCAAVCAWRLRWPRVFAAVVCLAFAAGGATLAAVEARRASRPALRCAFEDLARLQRAQARAEGRPVPVDDSAFATVTGTLRTDAAPASSGVSLTLDVDTIDGGTPAAVQGGVAATVVGTCAPERLHAWRAGRRVRMPVQLRRPSRYLDPGVPDNEAALNRRETTLVGAVKSGLLVEVVGLGHWSEEWAAAARASARRVFADDVGRWSRRSAAIVAAIVIGDRAGLDAEVERRLQEAGTYHVIAISGGNIAILAALMLGAFRVAGWLGRGAMVAAIVVLAAYAELVGGGASVARATLMATIYFAARAIDHRAATLNTLAFVAGCLVLAAPLSIADPAFILTFGATLAILLVLPIVPASRLPAGAGAIVSILAASVAAEAMLFPVGALVFSRVTFAGLVLNVAAIPLMGVAQIAGMALVPVAFVSPALAAAAGWVAHVGASGLVESAGLVRYVPAVTYRVAPPAAASVVAYYAGLCAWWTMWRRRATVSGSAESRAARRWRRGSAAVAVTAAFWILAQPWTLATSRGDGRLHVTFLDVGQGDATFVRFPGGATLLVDAGGLSASGFDIGDRVVAPVLRHAGVRRLDVLVLTHGDPDHIGGALSVAAEFRPVEIWEGIPAPPYEPLRALRAAAAERGSRWVTVKSGDRAWMDGVEVAVRHPPPADWERQRVRNDDSVVIELRWGDVSILLTGDVERGSEPGIVSGLPRAPLRVAKLPHHGSRTSSSPEFVTRWGPHVGVVSVGRSNSFGHPDREVLERYQAVGAAVFRTDMDGAITVDTDGTVLDMSSFNGRRLRLSATTVNRDGTKGAK
jgi:competence protein ComEC